MRTIVQAAAFAFAVASVTFAGWAMDWPARDYRGVSPGIDYKAH